MQSLPILENARDRFKILKKLQQTPHGFSALVSGDSEASDPLVLKVVRRGAFTYDPARLSDFFSWNRMQSHPHVGRVARAGINARRELYWIRHNGSEAPQELAFEAYLNGLASAVAYLHACGYLHQRIRPSNVRVFDGRLQLVDARPWGAPAPARHAPEDIHFTAPEVLRGHAPSPSSDLYSLGATLYHRAVGRPLFEDADPEALRTKYLVAAPTPLRALGLVADPIAAGIDRLLHKDPAQRAPALHALQSLAPAAAPCGDTAPLIDREAELAAVQTDAFEASPSLVFVCLEAAGGMGKSRLLAELEMRAPFYSVNYGLGKCSRPDRGLEPVWSALRGLSDVWDDGALPPGFLDDAAAAALSGMTEAGIQLLTNDLVDLAVRLSHRSRIVLALDDVHRASPATIAFLTQVCLRRRDIRGALILSSRSLEASPWISRLIHEGFVDRYRVIRLLAVSQAGSERIARNLRLPPDIENRILDDAGGNPFFIVDKAARDPESGRSASWRGEALEHAGRDAAELVRFLSVAGATAPAGAIREVLEMSEERFLEALHAALREDLVKVTPAGLALRHPLSIARAVYSSISATKRARWHAAAFRCVPAPTDVVALHALNGGLHEDALRLCLESAAALKEKRQFARALDFFRLAARASAALGRELPLPDQMEIAECYAQAGRHREAQKLYDRLLASGGAASDAFWKPRLYMKLAADPAATNSRQLHLYNLALQDVPPDSEESVNLRIHVAQTLVRMGKIDEAQAALDAAGVEHSKSSRALQTALAATRGLIHLAAGRFREANRHFSKVRKPASISGLGVMANMALSLECMGKLAAAESYLRRVCAVAKDSGFAFSEIMSHNNLGSVLRKQGRFEEAEREIGLAIRQLERFRSKDRSFPSESLAVIKADMAMVHLDCGRYAAAGKHLQDAGRSEARTALDNMSIALSRCEFMIRVGELSKARHLLQRLAAFPLAATPYFQIELALLEASLRDAGDIDAEHLKTLLGVSDQIGTQYQKGRLLLLLGRRSRTHAQEAFRIAKRNGYRPLLAQAMMHRGMSSEHPKEREHWFKESLRLALDLGLRETAAEAAYYLGALQLEAGRAASGKEHLLKSAAITSELAAQAPARCRAAYLAKPWRKDARRRLEACAQMQPAPPSGAAAPDLARKRDDSLLAALYRIGTAANAAQRVDVFLSELQRTLDGAIGRPVVMILTHGGRTIWRAARIALSDKIQKRVLALAAQSGERPRFNLANRGGDKPPAVWIPFRGARSSGGLYVACTRRAAIGEREMEFLSILGLLAAHGLDRLDAAVRTEAPVVHRRDASQDGATDAGTYDFHGIVGRSRAMRDLAAHIESAASNDATVLIEAETGAGKELVARAIHKLSRRAAGPFIAVDCGAIPEGLIESELFGARRGSYTGAVTDRPGLFEAAHRGTLFLDEISNMNPGVQAKLLRVLQEREVRRVGETRGRPVDVRLIAAANARLSDLVEEGRFRQDLLYRLNVLYISIPPLRRRAEDIPLLASHFLERLNARHGTQKRFGPAALDPLFGRPFHGNVRELQNAVERSYFMSSGPIIDAVATAEDFEKPASDEVHVWFKELSEGRKNFWTAVHDRYKRRDISREKVIALVDLGLRATRGSYKGLASLFRVGERDYRRLMDFLRRNKCLLDFRPYRKASV